MKASLSSLSPSITKMIRMDHTHVLATFHRYTTDASDSIKQGLADTVMLALEIHAQLEEEIFYPALRGVAADQAVLDKSKPEHDEMRRLIGELRGIQAGDPSFDTTFMQLMRDVIHHVADEETVLLPSAETLLADRLSELGAQMTKRRLQLLKPHMGELAVNTARAMSPGRMLLMGAGALTGAYVLKRALEGRGAARY